MQKHHLMIDRRWIDWSHGPHAPEGTFRLRVCPPVKQSEPVMGADKAFAFDLAGFGLTGPNLHIESNVAVEPGGELRAALSADDKPLPGYGFEDAVPITGDQPAARVTWNRPTPLEPWMGKPVR